MPTILITGANRGLGLALTRSFADLGWLTLACCRTPDKANDLQELAAAQNNITIHRLDVTDAEQISSLAAELSDCPIDILFNNAGIHGPSQQGFGETNVEGWLETFRVNSIAPLKISEALVEQVAASQQRIIAVMGSIMGSIADNSSGRNYAYRSSKAALHMVTRGLSVELADRGIIAVVLHPGWVRTDIGGDQAALSTEESAAGLTRVLLGLDADDNGKFFDYSGAERPW